MGTIKQTIVLMLLSFTAIFIACSDDNDPIIDPVIDEEQPAEELETYVVFTAGYGDETTDTRAMTKADDDPNYAGSGTSIPSGDSKEFLTSYEDIYNYAIGIFDVKDGLPNDLLGLTIVKSESGKPLLKERDPEHVAEATTRNQLHGHDGYGFNLMPLKFKTNKEQIALIVVANASKLEKKGAETTISNYEQFKNYINSITLPESEGSFNSYPMSSNIHIINITPGIVNGVGLRDGDGHYNAEGILTSAGFEPTDRTKWNLGTRGNYNLAVDKEILLYRCWSKVNLKQIKVETIDDEKVSGAKAAKFTLQEVFLMNVPKTVKMFNETKKVNNDDSTWKKWGFQLGFDVNSYLDKGFYSGYSKDDNNTKKDASTGLVDGTTNDRGFRNQGIADNTIYNTNYVREVSTTENSEASYTASQKTSTPIDLEYVKLDNGQSILGENGKYTFVVSPNDYGVSITNAKEEYSERAIVLSIKGIYEQQLANDEWINYGEGYYSLVINDDKDKPTLGNKGVLPTNISNTVMRNVEYNITATIKGPGSPTPVLHQPWSYIVPKITIVPFGVVEQNSTLD